jgi:Na+/citrate or Na+/malate symporter
MTRRRASRTLYGHFQFLAADQQTKTYQGAWIMTDTALPGVSGRRRIAFYIPVVLLSLALIVFTGFIIPLLPGVIAGWFNPDLYGIHQLHEMSNGALTWVILAGVLLQLHRPERKVAAIQMANVVVLVSLVVSLATGTFFPGTLVFLLFTVTIAWLHPRRQEMLRFGRVRHPALLALVVVAAVPLLFYAAAQISLQLGPAAADEHGQFAHYASMANVVVTLLLLGLLASFGTTGWRIPAWAAGSVAVVFGLTSVVFPGQTSSVSLPWAIATIVWGLAFIGVAEWRRRGL